MQSISINNYLELLHISFFKKQFVKIQQIRQTSMKNFKIPFRVRGSRQAFTLHIVKIAIFLALIAFCKEPEKLLPFLLQL